MADPLRTDVKKVGIGAIRDELTGLWASEALNSQAVIRASTHNLIVVSTSDDIPVSRTVERLAALTAERPGRIILVEYHPERFDTLDAWVTVTCRPQGQRQLCSEMIVLEVGHGLREEVHSTVIALLAPDLPVYLWWMQQPDPADHLFQNLLTETDRVIVDSDAYADPFRVLPVLASLIDVTRLSDLGWARLTPWRRLVAQLWDMPDLRPALAQVRTVEVGYATPGGDHSPARALLLVGWLADRLGWELTSVQRGAGPDITIAWTAHPGPVEAKITAIVDDSIPPGEVMRVALQAGQQPPYLAPHIQLAAERGCVEVRLGDGASPVLRRGSRFERVSTAAALAEELDFRYDPTYEQALQCAVAVLSALDRPVSPEEE